MPLLESMYFDVPILARKAAAVPETLGDAGVLIREKRLDEIAMMAHAIVTDEALSRTIVEDQDRVLETMDARDDHALLMGFVRQALDREGVASR